MSIIDDSDQFDNTWGLYSILYNRVRTTNPSPRAVFEELVEEEKQNPCVSAAESDLPQSSVADKNLELGRSLLELDAHDTARLVNNLSWLELMLASGSLLLALWETKTPFRVAKDKMTVLTQAVAQRIVGDLREVSDLRAALSGYPAGVAVAVGDHYLELGSSDKALIAYESAIELADPGEEQAHLGYLFAHRAGLACEPLHAEPMPDEGDWRLFGLYSVEQCIVDGPSFARREDLTSLSLRAYGHAYLAFADRAADALTETCEDAEFGGIFLTLDGLNVVFSELGEWQTVDLVCRAYDEWPCGEVDDEIDNRFLITRAWLAGRHAGRPIGSQQERKVVATQLSNRVGGFNLLPLHVREYLTSARMYLDRSDKKADYAHVVTELYRALEGTLQFTTEKALSSGNLTFLEDAYKRERPKSRRSLNSANLPAFKDTLRSILSNSISRPLFEFWLANATQSDSSAFFARLVRILEDLVERDRARHANESWKVARQSAEDMYSSLVGVSDTEGLIPGLLRSALRSSGGENLHR